MPPIPLTLGQAAAKLPDPTVGQIAAGMLVLSVIAGSMVMMSVWIARARRGTLVMPFAARKPLIVPLPLVAFGLLLACVMAATVLASGSVDPELMGEVAVEEVTDDEGSAVEETAEKESEAEVDVTDADGNALVADNGKPEAKPGTLKQRLRVMMLANINANFLVLFFFGVTIWIVQKSVSRQQTSIDDVTYDTSGFSSAAAMTPAALTTPFPDLDAPPPELAVIDAGNPYAAATERGTEPNSLERWNFISELLFAFEAFLVAYLPTSIIRIAMVSALPEAKSHPFLEMIENGVDTEIMVLIFLMAVVVAPIVEELMFRVVIFGGMLQRNLFWPGMIISSILFGMAHGFPDCIALLPLAAVIAFTYSRRRSYRTAILVHFLFNFFNMMLAGLSLL